VDLLIYKIAFRAVFLVEFSENLSYYEKEVNDMNKKIMEEKAKEFDELLQKARLNQELERKGLKPKGRDYLREHAEREARPCHSCPPKTRRKCNIDSYRACLKRLHPQTENSSL